MISKLAKNEQGIVSLNVLKSRIRMRDCQSSLCTPGMCSNYLIVRKILYFILTCNFDQIIAKVGVQGWVVRKPITTNSGLKFIKGSIFLVYKCLNCFCFAEFEISRRQQWRTENINRKPH